MGSLGELGNSLLAVPHPYAMFQPRKPGKIFSPQLSGESKADDTNEHQRPESDLVSWQL